mgnify:CR=1 FL=1
MKAIQLQVAQIVPCTEAEGPGKRFALWFQGCPLRCPGCCNPEYLPFKGGTTRAVDEIANEIRESREQTGIEGITLLGGEPFAHAEPAAALAAEARNLGLSVMVFSGYTIEHLRTTIDPHAAAGIGDGPSSAATEVDPELLEHRRRSEVRCDDVADPCILQ